MAAIGVDLVSEDDDRYPVALAELPDHPLWLFRKGDPGSSPGVAVVGSRRATLYGIEIARTIGARVAQAGWTVVSGLAAGVAAYSTSA